MLTVQLTAPVATLTDGLLSWQSVDDATAYAIFRNGEFEALVVGATEYAITPADGDELSISAANAMGGFGERFVIGKAATAIEQPQSPYPTPQTSFYNINGQRVGHAYHGIVVNGHRKVVVR